MKIYLFLHLFAKWKKVIPTLIIRGEVREIFEIGIDMNIGSRSESENKTI